MKRLTVTVVVCTRNRAQLLDGCLAALTRQDYPHYDVVVVDNAPVDATTRNVAERHAVRYVVEPHPGLDRARNRGLAAATGDIVAFTDDDARPAGEWVTRIARSFESSPDVTAVTGAVSAAESATRAQRLYEHEYRDVGGEEARRIDWSSNPRRRFVLGDRGIGCNMAFRRDALRALGGFDPALDCGTRTGCGGDVDALQRVLEAGGTIEYRPDAAVAHVHRRTIPALRRKLFDNGRGYSAAMTAAFLRAPLRTRSRIVFWWLAWLAWWFGRRIAARPLRLLGVPLPRAVASGAGLPLPFVLAELAGAVVGPALYVVEHRRAASRALGTVLVAEQAVSAGAASPLAASAAETH